MAAQVNNVHPFVSSNAYYGYLPINPQQQQQQQQLQQQSQQQTLINNDVGMDVDNESCLTKVQNNNNNIMQQQKQQTHEFLMSAVDEGHRRWSQGRKRGFDRDEVANYMPCFKRFRDGDYIWSEDHRLAQVYHEPLLCLSPAADSDMMYEESTIVGSFKIQPVTSINMDNNTRSQEFEDMLLMTHGCSSYHHMSQSGNNEEAEF